MCASSPMHSLMETWVPLYVSVFVSQSPQFCSNTLLRMCTCISACIYVHPTAHVSSTRYGLVTWEPGCPYVALCVCHNHPLSSPTPWLECVHTSVHVFMSTSLPVLAKHPMDSYMVRWIPVCGSVSVSQSPYLWSHILIKICSCISTCNQVHFTL